MHTTYTLTFGDQAENHVRMQKIGQLLPHGLSHQQLSMVKEHFENIESDHKMACEMYHLNDLIDDEKIRETTEPAYVLVVRNGLRALLAPPQTEDTFFEEQKALPKDTKALMYGRVVDKHARHNLCFGDFDQEPDYATGKGTVVNFDRVPHLAQVRQSIENLLSMRLVAEGNYYNDCRKNGIGYHGDSERRVVIAVRVGATMPIHFRWYHDCEVISRTLKLSVHHGDVYFMSEKATGYDWKMRSRYTLRHAAGARKFLDE